MFSITQTSDGFLWFLSLPGDIYRFDGVRFLPRHTPADFSSSTIGSILADHAGGLWVVADGLIHLKGGVVTSHFAVNGTAFQSISEDPDGSVWVATRRGSDQPFCHVAQRSVRCFGKNDGIPISACQCRTGRWSAEAFGWVERRLSSTGTGGVSEVYPVKAGVMGLARASDGTVWVGIQEEGPGRGLEQLKDGVLKPFVTPTFDGSKLSVTSLMFDRDGNLWVGTRFERALSYPAEMLWSITATRKACPAIPCGLFLKTGKASSGLEPQAASTAFAIHVSSRSRPWRDWGRI